MRSHTHIRAARGELSRMLRHLRPRWRACERSHSGQKPPSTQPSAAAACAGGRAARKSRSAHRGCSVGLGCCLLCHTAAAGETAGALALRQRHLPSWGRWARASGGCGRSVAAARIQPAVLGEWQRAHQTKGGERRRRADEQAGLAQPQERGEIEQTRERVDSPLRLHAAPSAPTK